MYTRSDYVHHGGDAAVEVLAMVVPWILWLEKNWTVTLAHGQHSLRWTAAFMGDEARPSRFSGQRARRKIFWVGRSEK